MIRSQDTAGKGYSVTVDALDNLANWTKFRPKLCQGCTAGCCRLPVEANAFDMVRLGLLHEDEACGGLKKAAKHLLSTGKIRQFRASTGLFTLMQTMAGDCTYLGPDRRCTVYENRPGVCRRFPEVGPRPGYCPARKIER
ncbi:MAG: YkgJ family cysteine cluster protein [Proteobacteria bacterium]|nr:YkgJ family cysteine cluster protein [Pseudomonadota bacterium]